MDSTPRDPAFYVERLKGLLQSSSRAVAFTGAGVSEESGIPTFRGKGGLWDRYPPSLYANPAGLMLLFLVRPSWMAAFFSDILDSLLRAKPNPCHRVIAQWEEEGFIKAVITQNVDDLHSTAGSVNVYELHGNAFRVRCVRCGDREKLARERLLETAKKLNEAPQSRRSLLRLFFDFGGSCRACGGRRRPDVVLFGEGLPQEEWDRALRLATEADLFMVIGTSSLVYPAALLPRIAAESDARIVEINPEPTPVSSLAALRIPFPAGKFFSLFDVS